MKDVSLIPAERYGYDFIPSEYLPQGKDEYWLRNKQVAAFPRQWRKLQSFEIEILVKNDNFCAEWDDFLVSDPFDPTLIRNSNFYGLVRIGVLKDVLLQHHDFRIQAGIRNSTIISCDIGDNCAIQDCTYISHYILGNMVILSRIDEMQTTNHAKFGNGVLKKGEQEAVRVWIDVMNEAGGRSVLPFEDMICADAYLWAAYRDDKELMNRLAAITQDRYGSERGTYGVVGSWSVIKSCNILKDVAIGECAYIKGANKLKNLTIHSNEEEATQIGEGVELVNGIVGYGSRVFYGCKAVRFVMGRNSSLKYGARLIHSILGDNSTVSCCEMLNNLVFPAHEQHHNNSFLIASLIEGLSNIAAGATVGSNHNSRANDGELRAGRGFWPGLCVTLKHSSCFASYVLISKGDYPYELNIPFPFSLVNNDIAANALEVMPAYTWMYNMYALERNSWKAAARDKRKNKVQHIHAQYLAPDTADEIVKAMDLMALWTGKALLNEQPEEFHKLMPGYENTKEEITDTVYRKAGRRLLESGTELIDSLDIQGSGMERHTRPQRLLKVRRAWMAYTAMLHYYFARTILDYVHGEKKGFKVLSDELGTGSTGEPDSTEALQNDWVNLGGQLAPAFRVDKLRERIRNGDLNSWDAIHAEYVSMQELFATDAARHAWKLFGPGNADELKALINEAVDIRRWMQSQVYDSRAKDYTDPFRLMTYRNAEEMKAVIGNPEDNSFIQINRTETAAFIEQALAFIKAL